MAIDITALKTEVTTDPTGLGLVTPWNNGQFGIVLSLLNGQTVTGTKADRTVAPAELVASIVLTEYIALTQAQRDYLKLLSLTPFIFIGEIKAALNTIFTNTGAGTTQKNLGNMINRNTSRAETLFGTGSILTLDHLAAAKIA